MGCTCNDPGTTTSNIMAYACAGCADVGAVSDQVSRLLRKTGFAQTKASCLAGIGAGIQSFIDAAKAADQVIVIDGCEIACAKKMIEKIDIIPLSFIFTQMGLEKGNTIPSQELTEQLCKTIINQFS